MLAPDRSGPLNQQQQLDLFRCLLHLWVVWTKKLSPLPLPVAQTEQLPAGGFLPPYRPRLSTRASANITPAATYLPFGLPVDALLEDVPFRISFP